MQICKFKIITMLQSLRHLNHLQMLLLLKLTITGAQLLMLGYQAQNSSLWKRFATTTVQLFWHELLLELQLSSKKKVLLLLEFIPSPSKIEYTGQSPFFFPGTTMSVLGLLPIYTCSQKSHLQLTLLYWQAFLALALKQLFVQSLLSTITPHPKNTVFLHR